MPQRQASFHAHGLFRIEGACFRPQSFSHMDLAELHPYYQVDDLGTVDERLAGKGVRLRGLIDKVGPDHGAHWMTVESADGEFCATLPLAETSRTAIVVYEKDAKPLSRDDGGPARFVIPYHPDRCANVKSLGRIVLSKEPGRDTRPSTKAASKPPR
ncbi:MAG: molybdopterin-dependent oxidoreductase [Planctomycetota bacterium]